MVNKINLSNVKNFKDFLGKVKYDLKLDSSNHTLKIYCLNSELSKDEFVKALTGEYSSSNFIGDFSHTSFVRESDNEEINFYSYKDPNSPAIFVFSIFAKGDLDIVVDQLIRKLPKTYYFWLPVSTFDNVKEEIIDKFIDENVLIDSFTAIRSSHFENGCDYRPHEHRKIEYVGKDGLEASREMRSLYGVLPKKISFKIAEKIKFSMDQRNTFIINYGLPYLDKVFEVIQISLSKFAEIDKVLSRIRFEKIVENGNVDFEINPFSIHFGNRKGTHDIDEFFELIEKDQEGRYCVLNPLIVEGSLFFSATILDVTKKAIFSVSGNEDVMNILPQSNCGKEVVSRFYEEVDLNLDNHTKVIAGNAG